MRAQLHMVSYTAPDQISSVNIVFKHCQQRHLEGETGALYSARKEESAQINEKYNDGCMSKGPMSQRQDLSMAKAGTI